MQIRSPLENSFRRMAVTLSLLCTITTSTSLGGIFSDKSKTRAGGSLGYGYSESIVSGQKSTEEPGAFNFFAEYVIDSHKIFGAEHLRSLAVDQGQFSTAISFTGLYMKWFNSVSVSEDISNSNYISGDYLIQRNIAPYFEAGVGFAQSSIRDKVGGALAKGAVGVYLSAKVGFELPLYRWMGAFWDLGYERTVIGEGTISMQNSCLGLYFYF